MKVISCFYGAFIKCLSIRLRYFRFYCTWYTGGVLFRVENLKSSTKSPSTVLCTFSALKSSVSSASHPASRRYPLLPTRPAQFPHNQSALPLLSFPSFISTMLFLPSFSLLSFFFFAFFASHFLCFFVHPFFSYAAWQFSKVTRLFEIKHPNLPWLVTTNSSPAKLTPTHQQKCRILKCRKSTVCIFQCELCNVHCGIWNRLYAMYIVKCELSNVNPNSQAHFLHCAMRVVKLNVCVSRCAHCAFHIAQTCALQTNLHKSV